jgi:hypothetical protein
VSSASPPPHLFINGILRGQRAVESRILAPGARDIAEIASLTSLPGNASTPDQGFDRHLVQAFATFAGRPAKSFVRHIRDITDGVLHAYIVGMTCKQAPSSSIHDYCAA